MTPFWPLVPPRIQDWTMIPPVAFGACLYHVNIDWVVEELVEKPDDPVAVLLNVSAILEHTFE
jgi:hypothetical protein